MGPALGDVDPSADFRSESAAMPPYFLMAAGALRS